MPPISRNKKAIKGSRKVRSKLAAPAPAAAGAAASVPVAAGAATAGAATAGVAASVPVAAGVAAAGVAAAGVAAAGVAAAGVAAAGVAAAGVIEKKDSGPPTNTIPPYQKNITIRFCLNMIVGNEEKNILPLLNNMKGIISAIAISANGKDKTMDLIKEWHAENPHILGGVDFKAWTNNFRIQRNYALVYAEEFIQARYKEHPNEMWFIWGMDADDRCAYSNDESKPISFDHPKGGSFHSFFKKNGYLDQINLMKVAGNSRWPFGSILRIAPNESLWEWYKTRHEVIRVKPDLLSKRNVFSGTFEGIKINWSSTGHRANDPLTYTNDLNAFLVELRQNPKEFDERDYYYTAQSAKWAHFDTIAKYFYKERAKMVGAYFERYLSYINLAVMRRKKTGVFLDQKAHNYELQAYEINPVNYQAPVGIVQYFRLKKLYQIGYALGKQVLTNKFNPNTAFVDLSSEWRLWDEYSLCCYYVQRYDDYEKYVKLAVKHPLIDEGAKKRIWGGYKEFYLKGVKGIGKGSESKKETRAPASAPKKKEKEEEEEVVSNENDSSSEEDDVISVDNVSDSENDDSDFEKDD